MYLNIERISVDHDARALVLTDSERPIFSWAAQSDGEGGCQTSYHVTVSNRNGAVWESGETDTKKQSTVYGGPPLESGEIYMLTVTITDNRGVKSKPQSARFCYLSPRTWRAKHITVREESNEAAKYFFRGFTLNEKPLRATLYASGIGYQYITVNGENVEKAFLSPSVSAYDKRC